ncbi:MAG TPA: hypothetical protein VER33_20315, partial [Polyangiaceae bacterium]|nr:hypothetical protein [Polyangiaceae bacterium]
EATCGRLSARAGAQKTRRLTPLTGKVLLLLFAAAAPCLSRRVEGAALLGVEHLGTPSLLLGDG